MARAKLTSTRDAIARHVPDGASVCIGAALEAAISFAAGHEIIRQGKRELTLVGPISDMLLDQLIGAGCARRVVAAWVGSPARASSASGPRPAGTSASRPK